MREVVFDTETTGLDPASGHRVVEIGCVELINLVPSGETFHTYLNPERDVPQSAIDIHGLTTEFLSAHPVFGEVAEAFLEFIGESDLVAHNADFDMRFINWELENAGLPRLPGSRATDTLALSRARFPGAQHSLDALCRRFGIDNSNRSYHGALLDSQILAEVYLELKGGRQAGLELGKAPSQKMTEAIPRQERPRRLFAPSEEEIARHKAFVAELNKPIWKL